MDKKVLENIILIIVGAILLIVIGVGIVNLSEIILIVVGFIGFALILDGIYGLYNYNKKKS